MRPASELPKAPAVNTYSTSFRAFSEFTTVVNVLIARSNSSSDQAENASFASSIEHVHNFTVTLPHRMHGMTFPPAR